MNPESPRWLISRNRLDEGLALLKKLIPNEEDAEAEFKAIQEALAAERSQGKERLFCYRYRKLILLAIAIAAFNQLSGINAILYYAPMIFRVAGASRETALQLPMLIGLANFVFTLLALVFIDGLGRKKLMYIGSFGYIISLSVVGGMFALYSDQFKASFERIEAEDAVVVVEESASADVPEIQVAERASDPAIPKAGIYGVLAGLILFIAAHAFGQGACIWVFIGEIFPNAVRAQGQALGSFTHWALNAVVSGFFPVMLSKLGPSAVFFTFCGFMVLQLLWVAFVMPETKQIPLEEMQRKLGITD